MGSRQEREGKQKKFLAFFAPLFTPQVRKIVLGREIFFASGLSGLGAI